MRDRSAKEEPGDREVLIKPLCLFIFFDELAEVSWGR
jgi:hypothetical protein